MKTTLHIKRIETVEERLKFLLVYAFCIMLFVVIGHEKIAFAMFIIPLIGLSIWAVILYAKSVFRY